MVLALVVPVRLCQPISGSAVFNTEQQIASAERDLLIWKRGGKRDDLVQPLFQLDDPG